MVIGGALLAAGFHMLLFTLATICYVASISLFYIIFRNHQPLKEDVPVMGYCPPPMSRGGIWRTNEGAETGLMYSSPPIERR